MNINGTYVQYNSTEKMDNRKLILGAHKDRGYTHTHPSATLVGRYGQWITSFSSVITPLAEVAFHAFAGQSTTSQAPWNVVTIPDTEQRSAGSTQYTTVSTQNALGELLAQNNQLGRCILECVILFLKKSQSKHIKQAMTS